MDHYGWGMAATGHADAFPLPMSSRSPGTAMMDSFGSSQHSEKVHSHYHGHLQPSNFTDATLRFSVTFFLSGFVILCLTLRVCQLSDLAGHHSEYNHHHHHQHDGPDGLHLHGGAMGLGVQSSNSLSPLQPPARLPPLPSLLDQHRMGVHSSHMSEYHHHHQLASMLPVPHFESASSGLGPMQHCQVR